jgi:hypothetical protein
LNIEQHQMTHRHRDILGPNINIIRGNMLMCCDADDRGERQFQYYIGMFSIYSLSYKST